MDTGCTCAIEFQNASAVWPDKVRPLASVIVPEIITGNRVPVSSKYRSMANRAALAFRGVEDGFDQQNIGTTVDQPAHGFTVGCS